MGWITRANGRTATFALNIKPKSGPADARFIGACRAITEVISKELQ